MLYNLILSNMRGEESNQIDEPDHRETASIALIANASPVDKLRNRFMFIHIHEKSFLIHDSVQSIGGQPSSPTALNRCLQPTYHR